MIYETVYDIAGAGYDGWLLVFIGLGSIFLGIHFLYLSRTVGRALRDFGWLWLAISLLWSGWAVGASFSRYRQLRGVLESGGAKVVEGRADSFVPKGPGFRTQECFVVQGVRFCYNEYAWAGGFKKDSAHGGPMAPGLGVRIHFAAAATGNRILRLEVARPAPATQ